jgi:hypothetical protein
MGTIYNRSRSDDITVDGGGNDGIGSVHGLGTTGIAVLQLHRKFMT